MNRTNSAFLTDSYKLAHHEQYPEGTTLVFNNFTPRSNTYAPEATKTLGGVVAFGVQLTMMELKDHFDENFFFTSEREKVKPLTDSDPYGVWSQMALVYLKAKAINPIKEEIELFLGMEYDTTHFEKLWDLGYLPLEVRALDEGTICPIKVPMLTVHNTHPDFFWLPNFLETILSQLLWKPMTSATIALSYRKIMEKWANKTNPEGIEFVRFQGHDFSMRGLDAVGATEASGLGHLTSFYGTDSLPTLSAARYYYGAKGFIAGSVPATEHSVMSAGSKEGEIETFRRLMKNQPKGILSVVSDTWDLWNVLTNILPQLKEEVLVRDGKLVIRPDSGDPVDILCGVGTGKVDFTFNDSSDAIMGQDIHLNTEIVEIESNDPFTMDFRPHTWAMESFTVAQAESGEDLLDITELTYDEFISHPGFSSSDMTIIESVIGKINGQYYIAKLRYFWESETEDLKDGFACYEGYQSVDLTSENEIKGVIELLWDVFGGTINEQGYKVLDPHIGAIYGDSITHDRCEEICRRLAAKGFASTNVVFGIGSYTYQFNTRDTFGFAMKATYVEKWVGKEDMRGKLYHETEGFEIFKDPVTDTGMKKSARGLLRVVRNKSSNQLLLEDQIGWDEVNSPENQLKLVFRDGELLNPVTFEEIRNRVDKLV